MFPDVNDLEELRKYEDAREQLRPDLKWKRYTTPTSSQPVHTAAIPYNEMRAIIEGRSNMGSKPISVAKIPGGVAPVEAHAVDQQATTQQPQRHFIPRPNANRSRPQPFYGNMLIHRGHQGFGDQMHGAMGAMMGMNLSNQQASLARGQMGTDLKSTYLNALANLRGTQMNALAGLRGTQMNALAGLRAAQFGAMSPVWQEQIRASALAKALGMFGGGGKQQPGMALNLTSNIGQNVRG